MERTKAQKLAADAGPVNNAVSFGDETRVTENAPVPGFDVFSVLPEERKSYGIQDNETVAWVRNPHHWEKYENSDRVREFQRERPGARVVYTDGMDQVTNGDLILCAYPTALKEKEEAARTAEYNAHVYQEAPDNHPRDRDRLRHLSDGMRLQHDRDGMTGPQSPTSGVAYSAALERYTDKQIDAEEARYRRGSRQSSFDSQDWADMIDGGRSAERRAQAKSKSVGMGDTGFGRNPNSAVAQAARREGRA